MSSPAAVCGALLAALLLGGVVGYSLRPSPPVEVEPDVAEAIRDRERKRDALRRCAEWGVVDIREVGRHLQGRRPQSDGPFKYKLEDGTVLTLTVQYSGYWHWAPNTRHLWDPDARAAGPTPAPRELDMLLERSAIPYLTAAASHDPSDRMRVAATGLLVKMVEERLPGWFEEGADYHEACWSLLMALCVPQSGGSTVGPHSFGLLSLLRTTVNGDRKLGVAMVHALVAKMDGVDAQAALCFGNAIWQSHLRMDEIGDVLTAGVREGAQPRAVACACVLAHMGPGENRGVVEETLRQWLAEDPNASCVPAALKRLQSK